jgi:hypothetical protein
MPWAAPALIIASSVLSAKSAADEGASQQSIAKFNATLKEQEATRREQAGALALSRRKKESEKLLSSQRAAFAKAGVRGDTGSPLLTQIDTAENLTLDALTEQFNIQTGVQQARAQAQLFRLQGKSAARAGKIGVGSAALQGGSALAQLG